MDSEQQLERRHRLNQLMDMYGELLTERQRMFLELHVAEDLSFGEIADQHKVSRQAVHDSVKHAEMGLENFEDKLKLLAKRDSNESAGTEPVAVSEAAPNVSSSGSNAEFVGKLKQIIEELRRSGGVIYNANDVADQIESIISELEN